MKTFKSILILSLFSLLTLTSCEKKNDDDNNDNNPTEQKGVFKMELEHFFDSVLFQLNQNYVNGSSEDLNFSTVKYYLTNIKLANTDGSVWSEEESYRLVDLSDPASLMFEIDEVPTGDYHMLMFTIGVDSARNVSGAQTGALSPANGMFWSWNNGYIFFKLEGTSPQAPNNNFTYHIGGFKEPNNALAEHGFHMHMPNMSITPNASPVVHLEVDLKQVFDGMHTLSVANLPTVTMPGMMAVHISHNFSGAFSLDHVHP